MSSSQLILHECKRKEGREKVWDPVNEPLMALHQSQRDAERATRRTCSQRGAEEIWIFPSINVACQKVEQDVEARPTGEFYILLT